MLTLKATICKFWEASDSVRLEINALPYSQFYEFKINKKTRKCTV